MICSLPSEASSKSTWARITMRPCPVPYTIGRSRA